jgi:hypothetical protein
LDNVFNTFSPTTTWSAWMKTLLRIKPTIVNSYAILDPPNMILPISQISRTSG